jgi:hypothetical protein
MTPSHDNRASELLPPTSVGAKTAARPRPTKMVPWQEVPLDLNEQVQALLANAYRETAEDVEYQQTFAGEGARKVEYILGDLRRHEALGDVRMQELAYLSIGGADGSEAEYVLSQTDISHAVMVETSSAAVEIARDKAQQLARQGKKLVVLHGDATALLDQALEYLEGWCAKGEVTGLVVSAQAVLHELPTRSPSFDLPLFLGKIFRYSGWNVAAFYSREPCVPDGWPSKVRVRIPGFDGQELARCAKFIRDRLHMLGAPEVLGSGWVALPGPLAIETLHKLIRGASVQRIGYELGERLTGFDPMAVKNHLESCVDGMNVTVEYLTTPGFRNGLREYGVEYRGHDSESLPVPRTHAEIIGFSHGPRSKERPRTKRRPAGVTKETRRRNTSSAARDITSAAVRALERIRGITRRAHLLENRTVFSATQLIRRAYGQLALCLPSWRMLSASWTTSTSSKRLSNPFQGHISDEHIQSFLHQFRPDERRLVIRMLESFTYISSIHTRRLLVQLSAELDRSLCSVGGNVWYAPLGGTITGTTRMSNGAITSLFRSVADIPERQLLDLDSLPRVEELENGAIVLLVELVASGRVAVDQWRRVVQSTRIPASCRVLVAAIVSFDAGELYIIEHSELEVVSAMHLRQSESIFNSQSPFRLSARERDRIRDILDSYPRESVADYTVRAAGCSLLITFAHGTPDCVPSIFWYGNQDRIRLLGSKENPALLRSW